MNPLDFLKINGLTTPGVGRLDPVKQSLQWADSNGVAFDGQFTRFQSNTLKEFTFRVVMTKAECDTWLREIQPLLEQPMAGQVAKPVDVVHPYFTISKVRLAVTRELTGPYYDTDTEKGAWVVEWGGKEYRTPKPLPARLVQPLIGPEGQPKALSAIEQRTAAVDADTKARVAAAQAKRAGVPHK